MKKFLKALLLTLLLAVGVFLIGPRPNNDDQINFTASDIGDDLEAYLQNVEAKVSDITPGAEKEIIWADESTKAQTDIAVVYIHGFSATKYEIRPVPDKIATALNANLFYTRLKGHGQNDASLVDGSTSAWANDYAEAIEIGRRIGKRVLIVSTSTGGTLATWGASKPDLHKNVMGIVMVSPNFATHGLPTSVGSMPWAETLLPLLGGAERSWEPLNEQQDKWWSTRYPSKAIFPMFGYLRLVEGIDKSNIKTPAFFIYSPSDQVIKSDAVETVASEWGGPVKILKVVESSDPSNHILAGDIVAPENVEPVTEAILDWFAEL